MHHDTVSARAPPDRATFGSLAGELRTRALPAFLLATLTIVVDLVGSVPFAVLVAAVAVVMAWEWSSLVRRGARPTALVAHVVCVLLAIGLAAFGQGVLALVVLAIGVAVVATLAMGHGARLSALGVLYVGLPSLALVWLRTSEPWGAVAVLLVLASVWAMDTAALIGGKLIGGPRMWPAISPNKTWAGLLSGLSASAIVGVAFAVSVVPGASVAGLMVIATLLGFVSQLGDLVESAIKRHFAVKNTSNLIPGHGGFLDRLDGVVAAAVLAAVLAAVTNPTSPARALLFGV